MNGLFIGVEEVREYFADLLRAESFVTDKSGCKMLEMLGATFIANDEAIFGKPNYDYIQRELHWYESQSRNVNDIPGETPAIWKQVADKNGVINSNYGWCILSGENHNQYLHVLDTLKTKPDSRQAVMIYTRPTMHSDAFELGRHDFICTNAVQYVIRDNRLHCIVQMRSNDAWAGYRNDVAWQRAVLMRLAQDLDIEVGNIIWHAASLHIYERNFYLVDHYAKTGETHIAKKDYSGEW
jgi:thymidylate synthase